uniref:Uncharacterized protein n=1 Tax=Solanum lycopersicum TaxID=4081 RepID=A0A3Q7EET1_SOLLC
MDMDEETSMQKNNKSRWDLSIKQLVKTTRELSTDSELDANRNTVLNDTKASSVTNSSSVVASNHLDNSQENMANQLHLQEIAKRSKAQYKIVLQEVLRFYSIPENMFGRVCIIIDKLDNCFFGTKCEMVMDYIG